MKLILILASCFGGLCSVYFALQQPDAGLSINESRYVEALKACRKNKLDTLTAVFVDMSLHSGRKRLFLVDLQQKKLISSALCCHGMGGGSTGASPVFSNTKNSNCTSLGKYKTGLRSYSQYGIHVHYKLHGLESTNNNAFDRIVVLHSYSPVPESDIYPAHLPMGWSLGCPVTSDGMMKVLDALLQKKNRASLLWIYQ